MKLHTLIDSNNPKCLYCNGNFTIEKGENFIYNYIDIYKCTSCKETFYLCSDNGFDVICFEFTCNGLFCSHDYNYQPYMIGITILNNAICWNGVTIKLTYIPIFEISFSDKDSLSNKLNTYLTFS